MPTDPEKPARPLRRPLPLRYVLVLIVTLFAVPIITWLIWGQIEASRLDRVLDALEARHEPLDLKEFGVKPTTAAEKEAAHLYAEAGKLIGDRAIPTAEAARLSGIIGGCAHRLLKAIAGGSGSGAADFRRSVCQGV